MFVGNQMERQRQDVGALRFALVGGGGGIEKAPVESRLHPIGQRREVLLVVGVAEQPGRPLDDPAIAVKVGGADQWPRRRSLAGRPGPIDEASTQSP